MENPEKTVGKTLGKTWKTEKKNQRLQIIQMVGHFQQGSTNITNGLGVTL